MLKKFSLIALFAAVCSVSVQAAPWITHTSRRAPRTLVVVGNYKTPRLLAATYKGLTAQPYLVMTVDKRAFMAISKRTVEIPMDKLDVYINDLNPRRVVIIGDERYVTSEQEKMLRRISIKRIPIVRIYGGDWGRIAEELDDMLNIGNLAREFRRNYANHYMSDPRLREPGQVQASAEKSLPPAAPAAPAENSDAADEQDDDVPVSEPQEL